MSTSNAGQTETVVLAIMDRLVLVLEDASADPVLQKACDRAYGELMAGLQDLERAREAA